jgi:hypothetical protein
LKFPKYFPQKILKKREKKNKLEKGLKEKSSTTGPEIYISKQLKETGPGNIYFKTT